MSKVYYVNIGKNKENIQKLVTNINTENVAKIYDYLESTDFFKAPASHAFHHSYEGGLAEHCSEVFVNLSKLENILTTKPISLETKFILAFCHDLSKTNYYTIVKKNKYVHEERWERVDTYGVNDKLGLGHEYGSVYLLTRIIPDLEFNIMQAILFHHGAFNSSTLSAFSDSCRTNELVLLLHTADMMSAVSGDIKMKKVIEDRGW